MGSMRDCCDCQYKKSGSSLLKELFNGLDKGT